MKFSLTLRNISSEVRFFTTILFFALFYSNVYSQCPNDNLVNDPKDFQWTYHPVGPNNPEPYYSGTMEVGEATFNINGETLTTRAYRQKGENYSIPGPTIKVTPGNKYVLSFHNTLPYEPLSPDHNVFKDPNVSNMHTHGLHISGESPGDDVTRSFEGGRGGDFVYDIPADHIGGTYWYHAHHHGSSFLQVSGGLFGMLIVDDVNDGIPSTVAAMTEREIILGFLDPAAAGTGGDQLMSGTLSPTWTVNGLVEGNICMPPNTWQHWRVLLADRAANMKTLEFGPECEVMLLARDGVWRTVAPKDIPTNTLRMTGASRADFAIRATGNSWIKINGTIVANIYTNGTEDTTGNPFDEDGVSQWSAIRPAYLRDLRNVLNVNNESVSMGARTINGSKYNHMVPTFELPANQVQEWSLSGAVQHPFHLHVYHVQALSDDNDFEAGEYYDVVSSKMSVRFDLNQSTSNVYDGRTILHCHILGHEDQGAMGWLDVNGGAGPPTFPLNGEISQPYSDYYVLDGPPQPPTPPSGLTATATSSSTISLNWSDNSFDELGFKIERSTDGTAFNDLDTVGANINTYSDVNLLESTTYYYRVYSYNSIGNSDPTNVANATTQSSSGGVVMHVDDISIIRNSLNGNRYQGLATISVVNDSGVTVSGATVNGSFTGPSSSNESGITDANGQITFSSRPVKNPTGEWCFEVTDINLVGATYNASANNMSKVCESGKVYRMSQHQSMSKDISFGVVPNPFQNSTTIKFKLTEKTHVALEVYNLLGDRIALLTDKTYNSGQYSLDWNPHKLSNGMYFLQIKTDGIHIGTKRMIIIH